MTTDAPAPRDAADPLAQAVEETTEIASRLIRFDTQNWGEGKANPELEATEWIAAQLAEVGLDSVIHESEPGRANLVARIPGTDPDAGAWSSTATPTSCRRTSPSGRSTRSAVSSAMACCGAAARST